MYNGLVIAICLVLIFWATNEHVDAQIESGLQHELASLKKVDTTQGREKLITIISSHWQKGLDSRRYYLLVSKDGTVVQGGLQKWPQTLKANEVVKNIWIEKDIAPNDVASQDGYWPMVAGHLNDGSKLLIAQAVLDSEDLIEFNLSMMVIIFLLSISLTLFFGWNLGRAVLSRIDAINNTANKVTTGDLSKRLIISDKNDEFDELSNHLNTMLIRIEQLMVGMREVTDNTAHDLRSPLSRIRNRLEVTLLENRDSAEYREVIEKTVVETEKVIQTFNALLEISQAEAGSFRGNWETINLSTLANEVGELYTSLAEEENKQLTLNVESHVTLFGNIHLLSQVFRNLIENALKHTPKGTDIRLDVFLSNGHPTLVISDNGAGIPNEYKDFVLQRYTRLDSSRTSEGNGLGLSLVKAVIDLHGARLQLTDNNPGLSITISFKRHMPST